MRCAEMAVAERLDLASSYAYSDSITDLPMLELVGHPSRSTPIASLARVAREREWEVRYFQRPVRLRDRVPVHRKAQPSRRRRSRSRRVLRSPLHVLRKRASPA